MHLISALSGIEGHARTARSDAFPCIWRVHGFQNAEARSRKVFFLNTDIPDLRDCLAYARD